MWNTPVMGVTLSLCALLHTPGAPCSRAMGACALLVRGLILGEATVGKALTGTSSQPVVGPGGVVNSQISFEVGMVVHGFNPAL